MRAVRQGAGSPGEERPLEAVLQEGDLHALALPHRGPGRHQPYLPADHQGRQVRGVPLRQGASFVNYLLFTLKNLHFAVIRSFALL